MTWPGARPELWRLRHFCILQATGKAWPKEQKKLGPRWPLKKEIQLPKVEAGVN